MLRQKIIARLKDSRGAAIIEAAFILPICFLLIFTALEFGMLMFYSFVMESAMFDATRLAKVSESNAQTVQAVRRAMVERSYGLIPENDIFITTDLQVNLAANWQNTPPEQCQDPVTGNPNGQFCPNCTQWQDTNGNNICDIGPPPLELEAPGNLVSFVAFYKKPLFSPLVSFIANLSGNQHVLRAAAVVRNEPAGG